MKARIIGKTNWKDEVNPHTGEVSGKTLSGEVLFSDGRLGEFFYQPKDASIQIIGKRRCWYLRGERKKAFLAEVAPYIVEWQGFEDPSRVKRF